ncbi:MAG: MltA domain-containing protein [Proteobacteria bacterium]|nr:MltA domain-containing protein [Pseudomonadota bacterium]
MGKRNMMRKLCAVMLLAVLISGCAGGKPPRDTYMRATTFSHLPGWGNDNYLAALKSFQGSCRVFAKYNGDRPISKLTDIGGSAALWHEPCNEALSHAIFTNQQARKFFEKWFAPYEVADQSGSHTGKFTGYYEIILHGSRKKTKHYKYPVYGPPRNLEDIKGSSCISRTAINKGSLAGKGLEIAWVDNEARLFFMQIQGSGMILLPDGKHMKLGYAGQNGYDYTAIGPLFKNYCHDKIRSADQMMAWMHKHPKVGKEIMENNQSYVFFKEQGDGPIGGQGVPLIPERSIAIDHGLYPYGTPVWLATTLPHTNHHHKHGYHRLVVAQDTGGAIKGAVRADVFFGRGHRAEELAGSMNQTGSYFMLFPRKASIPRHYQSK